MMSAGYRAGKARLHAAGVLTSDLGSGDSLGELKLSESNWHMQASRFGDYRNFAVWPIFLLQEHWQKVRDVERLDSY